MTQQSARSINDLKTAFAQAKEKQVEAWKESCQIEVIEALSRAISDLNEIGVDVQLTLNGTSYRTTTDMSGTLRINERDYILFIERYNYGSLMLHIMEKTPDPQKPILQSGFDIIYNNAAEQLQDYIISIAVRDQIIQDHDVAKAFGLDKEKPFKLLDKPQILPRP